MRASGRLKQPELLLGLDTFSHNPDIKRPPDAADGSDQRHADRVVHDVGDIAAINLDGIEAQAPEIVEAGRPGTEVVDADPDSRRSWLPRRPCDRKPQRN